MKKMICVLTAAVIALYAAAPVCAEPAVPSAILTEKSTGTVLYEKNADEKRKPASVTKIMTMLLITEAMEAGQYGPDDVVTASANAAAMGGSQVYLKENEQMTVSEMLKCIAVASANDACVAMAEFTSGSVDAFVERMNERAAELGMTGTHFVNCTGLDADGHETTARDIATMSKELLKHDSIRKYTTIWTDSIRGGEFGLTNTNKLVRFYGKATGLKTGFTAAAGYCISATAESDGMELIAVIMGAPSSDERNAEARELLETGFSQYALFRADAQSARVKVLKGKEKAVEALEKSGGGIVVQKGREGDVERRVELCEDVAAPVEEGQTLGKAVYVLDGKVLAESDVTAVKAVAEAGVSDLFYDLIHYFLMV